MQKIPAYQRILSVITAACCFLVSAIAIFEIGMVIDCAQKHLIGNDPECPYRLDWKLFVESFYPPLATFFLIALIILALQKKNAVARRILLWWGIFLIGMVLLILKFA